jgi:hypothetical protein
VGAGVEPGLGVGLLAGFGVGVACAALVGFAVGVPAFAGANGVED